MEPIVFRPMRVRSGCIFVAAVPFFVSGLYGMIAKLEVLCAAFTFIGAVCFAAAVVQVFTRVIIDDCGISKRRFGRLSFRVSWSEIVSWDIREVGMDDEGDSFVNRIVRINASGHRQPLKIDNCEACRPSLETLVELLRAKLGDREKIQKR